MIEKHGRKFASLSELRRFEQQSQPCEICGQYGEHKMDCPNNTRRYIRTPEDIVNMVKELVGDDGTNNASS